MIWIFVGILLYWMLIAAERALVAVTPYETEVLRADPNSGSARRALAVVATDLSESLAALYWARVFLGVLLLAAGAALLLESSLLNNRLSDIARRTGLPMPLLWVLSAVPGAALIVLFVQRIHRFQTRRNAFWLVRLGLLIQCCRLLFGQLTPKSAAPEAAETVKTTNPATAPSVVAPISSERREIELLKSIIKFGDVTVGEVMQPRSRIIALDAADDYQSILAVIKSAAFSRFPVYEEDLDNVTGVLYVKDLVAHLSETGDFGWQKLVRAAPMVVPESKLVSELLHRFKQRKRHIAIVVDEHGGTSGLVTMEDILEEVTGEIRDEFDVEQDEVPPFTQLDYGNFVFVGQTHLNDVCRIAGIDTDTFEEVQGDADTLAGLLLELTEEIPATGTEVRWNGFLFTVTDADNRKINEVRFCIET